MLKEISLHVQIEERQVEEREALFESLYKSALPPVARYISKRGGTFEEAKDIFQDALVIFYEQTCIRKSVVRVSDEAYIFGIAKHLWIRKFKKDDLEINPDVMESINHVLESEVVQPDTNRLLNILELTGKKCMDLLNAFYYEQLPLEKIRQLFGYGTVRSATVQKFKCLEKVREKVKEKSISYGDLTE